MNRFATMFFQALSRSNAVISKWLILSSFANKNTKEGDETNLSIRNCGEPIAPQHTIITIAENFFLDGASAVLKSIFSVRGSPPSRVNTARETSVLMQIVKFFLLNAKSVEIDASKPVTLETLTKCQ